MIVITVYMTYNTINFVLLSASGNTDTLPLGVEPVLFGVFCMAYDLLFVGCKRLASGILRDAKAAAQGHS